MWHTSESSVLDAGERPAVDPFRQHEPPPEVAQVVREHAQLQPDSFALNR